MLTEE
jgi:peptide chain release factor subunit 1